MVDVNYSLGIPLADKNGGGGAGEGRDGADFTPLRKMQVSIPRRDFPAVIEPFSSKFPLFCGHSVESTESLFKYGRTN